MKINLDEWKNSKLESRYGKLEGRIAYGIREPMKSSVSPLIEDLEIIEIDGEAPHYWFVNSNQSVKVRLYFPFELKNTVYALVKDTNFFKAKIKKK